MELRHRAHARLTAARADRAVAALLGALARCRPRPPPRSSSARPRRRAAAAATSSPRSEVERIAARAGEGARRAHATASLDPTAYTRGAGRWQVSCFARRARGRAGARGRRAPARSLEPWTGDQVAWTMARGYEGAFGRKLNAPYVWIPLCLLFLVPFVDLRRPFRLLHLDLLVLLALRRLARLLQPRRDRGLGAARLSGARSTCSARMLLAGVPAARARAGALVPHASADSCSSCGLVFLVGFRIGLNVVDSNVIDVGYAGVIGADRIADGDPSTATGFSADVERGDTYGPGQLPRLRAVRAGASRGAARWDDLPAAHGAAIAFDLLTHRRPAAARAAAAPGPGGRRARRGARATRGRPIPTRCSRSRRTPTTRWWPLACIGALLALTLARARGRRRRGRGARWRWAPRRSSRRSRSRRCSRARGAAGGSRGAARAARSLVAVAAVRARRRPARALRPHGRLPGRAARRRSASGARRVARLAADRGEGGRGRAGAAVAFVPRRPDAASRSRRSGRRS